MPLSRAATVRPESVTLDDEAHRAAFEFVQSLAAELSRGNVELPAYPDVALRLREVLADEGVTNERVARVIASDAGLAARTLALANSAAYARGGRPFTDLKLAVTRIGHDTVRSAALAYALAQLRAARSLAHLREELAQQWRRSTLVAALARVLAVRTRAAPPDATLLAGLLHNVGCVYVLARAERHSALFTNAAVRDAILRDWHAQIGMAVAQNWGLPESVAEAIGEQDTLDRLEATRRDLVDVLCVAVRVAESHTEPAQLALALADVPAFHRLALDQATLEAALAESAEEISGLRAALGD